MKTRPILTRRPKGKTFVLAFLLFVLISPESQWALPSFFDELPDHELARSILDSMTPEELLGQVFFLGYIGKQPSEHVMRWIKDRHLGGVKIFTRNVASLTSLASSIEQMQSMALSARFHIPLLMATDQEGGWVRHIRSGNAVSPGNMAIAAGGIPEDAFLTGYYLGLELRYLGINMNFAPTVDVYSNPSAIVIGPRAFSSDPGQTGLFALAYFRGMRKAGIISTAKHYPGHGDTDTDSHGYLPEIQVTFETLWGRDLLPYRLLIKEGLPVIMGGHLAFPKILGNRQPSTLSPYFLVEVLRGKLGFEGVVITDDMEMAGVRRSERDLPEISLNALMAGNDMILLSHTPYLQDLTWQVLIQTIKQDPGFRERIKTAAERILRLKLRYLKKDFPIKPDVKSIAEKFPLHQAEDFFFNSACRAITLIKTKDIPYTPKPNERILLVGQVENFFREALKRFPGAEIYEFPYLPLEWSRQLDRQRVPELARNFDTVIFCLTNQNSLEVLKSLRSFRGKLLIVSTLTPVYLSQVPWVESAMAVYAMGSDSFRAGFSALLGEFEPEGKLPLAPEMNVQKFPK
ncbi:MAG TPA: glycoside hydrolase family 3 protein [Spirochaetia bacterium]|nr:glycoside hydrolase family 3 protein [Spirochaetia bacterium]